MSVWARIGGGIGGMAGIAGIAGIGGTVVAIVGRGGAGYPGLGPGGRAPAAGGRALAPVAGRDAAGAWAGGGCTMRGCETVGRLAGVSGRAGGGWFHGFVRRNPVQA